MGNHGVEHASLQLYAVIQQHLQVVLQVLSYLYYIRVLIDRTEALYCLLVSEYRNIPGFSFLNAETKAYQTCLNGVCTGGFCIQADLFGCLQGGNKGIYLVWRINQLIVSRFAAVMKHSVVDGCCLCTFCCLAIITKSAEQVALDGIPFLLRLGSRRWSRGCNLLTHKGAELQLLEDLLQSLLIGFFHL